MMVKETKSKSHCGEPSRLRRLSKIVKASSSAALLISFALASGCANYSKDHFTVGSVPDDYRSRYPIIISESETVKDIIVSSGARSLSARDTQSVRSMALGFRRSGAQSIAILIPTGSSNEKAARNLASDVIAILNKNNISANRISVHHYSANDHGDSATLRIVYTDLTANVAGKCGQWNEDLLDTADNKNYENFGCATQNNLAQAIAHPSDLLGPRGESNIDSTRRANVIDDWRTFGSGF